MARALSFSGLSSVSQQPVSCQTKQARGQCGLSSHCLLVKHTITTVWIVEAVFFLCKHLKNTNYFDLKCSSFFEQITIFFLFPVWILEEGRHILVWSGFLGTGTKVSSLMTSCKIDPKWIPLLSSRSVQTTVRGNKVPAKKSSNALWTLVV